MNIEFFEDPANALPLDDFLGLSPEQMHLLLYAPLARMQSIVRLRDTFERAVLAEAPVVKKVELLVRLVGEAGEAKATKRGRLPRAMVNALYDFETSRRIRVPSEEYSPAITALRHAVMKCGWLKKSRGRFLLSATGREIFENGVAPAHYAALLAHWLRQYDWGFADRLPPCLMLQQAAVFLLYVLSREAKEFIPAAQVSRLFIRAFPHTLGELGAEMAAAPWLHGKSVEEELGFIMRVRFLERFAAYFGLIDYHLDKELPYFEREKAAQVRTTKLFAEALQWFPVDREKSTPLLRSAGNNLLH